MGMDETAVQAGDGQGMDLSDVIEVAADQFAWIQTDDGELVGGQGATLEEEEDLVAFGFVRGPVGDQEPPNLRVDTEFFSNFTFRSLAGVSPCST
ncbi:hypothetical protein BJY14_004425 [Actinomadura luteofluorescens]|uniref:Uncharacterized protein n=1 Tax=Actinomadura luteofluorescens TaxID=46163 RepID=A0A7Y9JGN1_9ACTN|nr:hypothetical protein [Actinomadura luteofluorescens]